MAHKLIAVNTLNRVEGPPISVAGVAYVVWVSPGSKGRWWFNFHILGGNPSASEECNLEAVEFIFGGDTIKETFNNFNFARQMSGDEEDIL